MNSFSGVLEENISTLIMTAFAISKKLVSALLLLQKVKSNKNHIEKQLLLKALCGKLKWHYN